jgi:hypothetical protein
MRLQNCSIAIASLLSGCGMTGERAIPLRQQPEVLAVCRQIQLDVEEPIRVDSIFVDSALLHFFAGHQDKSDAWRASLGHVGKPDADDIVNYALRKGFHAMETDFRDIFGFKGFKNGDVVRITVKSKDDSACKAYKYPYWQLFELRKLGLSPEHCVAVEKVKTSTAQLQLKATRDKIYRWPADNGKGESFAVWRMNIDARLYQGSGLSRSIGRLTEYVAYEHGGGKHGYQGWSWACADLGANTEALNRSISGTGNQLLSVPKVETTSTTEDVVLETDATDEEIAKLQWIVRPRCAGGGWTLNEAGTLWVADINLANETRSALHVIRGDKLMVAPMPREFPRGVYSVHSALYYEDGFVVNLTRSFDNSDAYRRLVVFDGNLRHVATWKLSAAQRDALVPIDPAKINRC